MTLSPKTKKIMLLLGAAVGGYVVYTKFVKKPATTPSVAAATKAQLISAGTIKTAAIQLATARIAATQPGAATGLGILEELGLSEELGSLGGSCFR